MTIPLLAALVLAPAPKTPSFAELMEAGRNAVTKANKGSFAVQFKSKSAGQARNGRYTVDYARPDTFSFNAQYDQAEVAASNRTFLMANGVITGFDWNANEVLTRPAGKTGSIVQRFGSVLPIDDPIRIAIDPDAYLAFFKPMVGLTGWTVKSASGAWVATYHSSAKGNTSFAITFDRGTHKLRQVTALAGTTSLNWIYSQRPPRLTTKLAIPPDARTVESFFERPIPPKYQSAAARIAVESSWRVYGRLTRLKYSVSDESGVTQVAYAKDDIHQQSAGGSWSYVGGRLHAEAPGKAPVDRKATWRVVDTIVGQLGMPVEPMLRHFAKGDNPLARYIGADLTAKLVGQIGFGKVVCDVVELNGKGIKLTLTIRRDNHLLHAVESVNKDPKGRIVGRSERRFSY